MQSNGVKTTLNAIHFPTTSIGYSVGEEGTVIKTTDGGIHWSQQSSGLYQPLYGVFFANSTEGWATGDSAVIMHTTTGGTTWIEQHSHTDPTLYSVHFINGTYGWAVGDFGTILYSSNSGSIWVAKNSGTTTTLLGVKFYNSKVGWAVGYGGLILKTTNGGTSWDEQTSGTSLTLYSIEIVDSNRVYISGDFGAVLRTLNGGQFWTNLNTGADVSLYAIDFYSPTLGWAVGDDGVIVGTTNGGSSWQYQNSMTTHTLWGVQAVKGTTGGVVYAAGIGGTIVCAGVSPLPARTWTGAIDSFWTTAGNWSPIGVPEKLDSVFIPPVSISPVVKMTDQQMNIAALNIAPSGKLTIYNGLAEFFVKDNILVNGRLQVVPASSIQITTGGDFFVGATGTFDPGNSTIVMNGPGQIRGTFCNVLLAESSKIRSIGNITIKNSLLALSDLDLRSVDTLTIQNPNANAFGGPSLIANGTIKRALKSASTDLYRFESPVTFLQFYPTGTLPDTVTMTVFPHTLPPAQHESLFVRRYYTINATGGSNYLSFMSLRFDTSETTLPIYNLSLFRDSGGVLYNMNSPDYLDSDVVAVYADSVKKFSQWYFGRADYYPKHPYEFRDSLFLTDNGSIKDTLIFGAIAGATDGIDAPYGETALGPPPGSGTFDVRWVIPSSNGTIVDIVDLLNGGDPQNVYTCKLQPGPGGYPFTVAWNISALPVGTFFLRDQSTHGGQFNLSMKVQGSYTITNPSITQIEVVHIAPAFYDFASSWNLVSLPLTGTSDGRKIHVFPTAVSQAFGYNNGYYLADTLKNSRGYWVKFGFAQHIAIDGLERTLDTMTVLDGWNLVGSISNPVAIGNLQQIPPNIVTSPYYSYVASYVIADSIKPARGYWVKTNGGGKIVISSSEAAPKQELPTSSALELLQDFNTLNIANHEGHQQTLYFGAPPDPSFDTERFELPPAPPDELFDARFSSGSMVDVISHDSPSGRFHIQSREYPVTISWRLTQPGATSLSFHDANTGKTLYRGSAKIGSMRIENPAVTNVDLLLEPDAGMPKEFSLKQNYPNPFNPSTAIHYSLPVESYVTLTVYNMLGQEMVKIVDAVQDAGFKSVEWDAANSAAGVYFYRLTAKQKGGGQAGSFVDVKKMLLIK
jgi:photosystem II stability/assembly factor-like uncharacterized protein